MAPGFQKRSRVVGRDVCKGFGRRGRKKHIGIFEPRANDFNCLRTQHYRRLNAGLLEVPVWRSNCVLDAVPVPLG